MKYTIRAMFTSIKDGEFSGMAWNTYAEALNEKEHMGFDSVSIGFCVVDDKGNDVFPEDDLYKTMDEAEENLRYAKVVLQ